MDQKNQNEAVTDQAEKEQKIQEMEAHYRAILSLVGADLEAEGINETPKRAAKALWDMTEGSRISHENIVKKFKAECRTAVCHDMVILQGIKVVGLCEHHTLPIIMKITIGYVPDKQILGLSKMTRIAHLFGRRLQNQERIAHEIAVFMEEILNPLGVAVTIDGHHLCSMARGVHDMDSVMKVNVMHGTFKDDPTVRSEFLLRTQNQGGVL